MAATGVVLSVATAGCHRRAAAPPADPMLVALRAEARAAGLSYAEAQGRLLFVHYCATCHGDEGKGDGQNASNLNPAPRDLAAPGVSRDPAYLRHVIADGSAAVGRSPLSPPWGRLLRPREIDDLVLYCRSLGRPRQPAQPSDGPGRRDGR